MGIDLNNINLLTITPPTNNIFGGVYFNEAPSDLFTGYNNGTNNDVFNENVFNNTGTSPSSTKLVTFKEMFKNAKENTRKGSIENAAANSTNSRPFGNSDKKVLENKKDDIKTIYSILKSKTGLDDNAIYGVLGNIYIESGFNPGIEEDTMAPNKGFGLIQWTGPRRDALKQYAESNGKKIDNIQTQIEYLAEELKDNQHWSKGYSLQGLNNLKEDSTIYFGRAFVRPKEELAHWNRRANAASYIKQLLNN